MEIKLPAVSAPIASYVHYVIQDKIVYISGQLPMEDGKVKYKGKLGDNMTLEEGQKAAELCAKFVLAQLKEAVHDFAKVKRCIKISAFINSTPDFIDHPKVINAASDLIVNFLGEKGKHTRESVGVASLPLGVAVEIGAIFAIE